MRNLDIAIKNLNKINLKKISNSINQVWHKEYGGFNLEGIVYVVAKGDGALEIVPSDQADGIILIKYDGKSAPIVSSILYELDNNQAFMMQLQFEVDYME